MRSQLRGALERAGFEVRLVGDGASAQTLLTRFAPDVVVLDMNLALIDGLELCARWRAQGIHTPVLFITRRARLEDRLHALDIGGDCVLMKPLVTDELVARMGRLLWRVAVARTGGEQCGTIVLDDRARRALHRGRPLQLSATEFRLLRFLLVNRGQVLSRNQILQSIWGPDHPSRKAVDVYVGYLRRKLPESVSIRTVRSLGYVLEPTTFA